VKQLVILSGKGGTGKTTVAAALAHLASQEMSLVLVDADVDAANLELVLDPLQQEQCPFAGGQLAVIDAHRCTACGICAQVCRFDALISAAQSYLVDSLACEGCASCFYQCPEEAIRMEEQQDGQWFRSATRFGPLFHAHLFAGRENSGKLVTLVKQQARLWARKEVDLLVVDGPPGIGCPVISACSGMDLALLVVEPTISGQHDLERILATTEHFRVPSLVVINKADLSPARCTEISAFCAREGVALLGHIPYDDRVTEAMVRGLPVTAYTDGPVAKALEEMWMRVKDGLFA
jgi:MinD superfamily P-loop ATPase